MSVRGGDELSKVCCVEVADRSAVSAFISSSRTDSACLRALEISLEARTRGSREENG